MPKLTIEPMKIKETFVYSWRCGVCSEDAEIRVSIPKSFLSCPICGLTVRRHGIAETAWHIAGDDVRKHAPEKLVLELEEEHV
jgi:hypothetical protein